MNERNKKFDEAFELFKEEYPKWDEYLTDSTYYELKDWYAAKYGFEWDDENGYPTEVSEFGDYIWRQLCPQEYDTTEYIKVNKELFLSLMQLLKDSCDEGNCFAHEIAKKYDINVRGITNEGYV